LEAKGKSTEGVETFEEFYGLLQSEAVMLQKKYQPQLRDGIKIAVDLVNSVKEDAKDGDVDIRVKIAPNNLDDELNIKHEKEKENEGKGKYVLNKNKIEPASDDQGKLLEGKKLGDAVTVNEETLIYIANEAEFTIIKDNRLLKTALINADGNCNLRQLYLTSKNPLTFLLDVCSVLNLEENNKEITISEDFRTDGEKTVQLLLDELKKIKQIKTGKQHNIPVDDYERIRRALDRLPAFKKKVNVNQQPSIKPALALAYHPQSGKYELGINNSGDPLKGFSVDLNDKLNTKVVNLKNQLKEVISDNNNVDSTDLDEYLSSLLGRQKVGTHAEVKAVNNLLNELDLWVKEEKDGGRNVSYSTGEILVAVIRTSKGNGQEIGYEFIRCPNCTLVLNALEIKPLTDNQDFLKNGVPQIKKK
jgi:hypothetical protein